MLLKGNTLKHDPSTPINETLIFSDKDLRNEAMIMAGEGGDVQAVLKHVISALDAYELTNPSDLADCRNVLAELNRVDAILTSIQASRRKPPTLPPSQPQR
jgi:hypothetical protein